MAFQVKPNEFQIAKAKYIKNLENVGFFYKEKEDYNWIKKIG